MYSLQYSKCHGRGATVPHLKKVLEDYLTVFNFVKAAEMLTSVLKDETARNFLFPSLLACLPKTMPKMEPEELVESPLLPSMILLAAALDRHRER